MPLEWISVLGSEALHWEATVGSKREWHGSLAGRSILGGMRGMSKTDGRDDYYGRYWGWPRQRRYGLSEECQPIHIRQLTLPLLAISASSKSEEILIVIMVADG